MKKLRSQILKICVIGLICSGLGLGAAQPAEAEKSSRDFANWLQSVAKKAHLSELEHKLAPLKKSGADLNTLIKHASHIVSENDEDFNLPLADGTASQNVHQILLVEWNQFQTGNSMSAIPPAPVIKSVISYQTPKAFTGGLQSLYESAIQTSIFYSAVVNYTATSGKAHSLVPMSGGIAIGAP